MFSAIWNEEISRSRSSGKFSMPSFSQETKHPVIAHFFTEERGRQGKRQDHGTLGPTSTVKKVDLYAWWPTYIVLVSFKPQFMGPTCVDFMGSLILHSEQASVASYKVFRSYVLHLPSFSFPLFHSKPVFSIPLTRTGPQLL